MDDLEMGKWFALPRYVRVYVDPDGKRMEIEHRVNKDHIILGLEGMTRLKEILCDLIK